MNGPPPHLRPKQEPNGNAMNILTEPNAFKIETAPEGVVSQ